MYMFPIFNFCWKFDDLNPVMPKVPRQRKLGQIGDIYLSPQRVFVQKEFFFSVTTYCMY